MMRHWAIKKAKPFTRHKHGRYWCPEGCGKKVKTGYNPHSRVVYVCDKCKRYFTEEQMGEIN